MSITFAALRAAGVFRNKDPARNRITKPDYRRHSETRQDDKKMRNLSRPRNLSQPKRAGIDRAAGRLVDGQLIRPLTAIVLLAWLVGQAQAIELPGPKGIQPQATPPDVQITQVKTLPASSAATTDVEIRWTAQVPRLITLDDFEAPPRASN